MATDPKAQLNPHSWRTYPIVYRAPQPLAPARVVLGRAVTLFGLPLLVAAPTYLCVAQANPFLGLLAATGFYVPSLLVLAAAMGASQYNQRQEQ